MFTKTKCKSHYLKKKMEKTTKKSKRHNVPPDPSTTATPTIHDVQMPTSIKRKLHHTDSSAVNGLKDLSKNHSVSKITKKSKSHSVPPAPSATATITTIQDVQMPTSTKDLTAADLSADQKTAVKKQCQKLYGYKHRNTGTAPIRIETAFTQLQQMMKEKTELLKSRAAAAKPSRNATS